VSELGRVSVEHREAVVVARVDGELDLSNWEQVREIVEDAVTPEADALVLDLSSTTYFDSAGVRLVFQLAERLGNRRQGLALAMGDNDVVQRVAELTGLTSHVACRRSVDDALRALQTT
jgi:anti-sigma B factor antagonist